MEKLHLRIQTFIQYTLRKIIHSKNIPFHTVKFLTEIIS